MVYTVAPGGNVARGLRAAGTIQGPNGLATTPDGRWLYVSDYAGFIFRVDMATKAVIRLLAPPDVALYGIDGLALHKGTLIGVQNGVEPARVVRLDLSPDGTRISAARIIDMNQPRVAEPTIGVVAGDMYYYVANSFGGLLRKPNSVLANEPLEEPVILKLKSGEARVLYARNLEHDVGVNESQSGMAKPVGYGADDLEPHVLPEAHGALVRGYDQVVLHRPVAARDRLHLRVLAHHRGNTFASGVLADDVAAITDVRTRTVEVRSQVVGPEELPRRFVDRHEHLLGAARPVFPRLAGRDVCSDGVGVPCAEDRLEDGPNRIPVSGWYALMIIGISL